MTIFAETERLILRNLEEDELPRLVELIGDWEVVRWISVVPFPYTLKDAQEFYTDMAKCYQKMEPQFYAAALKSDNLLIGGVGLHVPRNAIYNDGQIEIGYWLGKRFWGQGLMSEAAAAVRDIGFARPTTKCLGACTAPDNIASQKVLSKIGLHNKGVSARDFTALRGENEINKWLMTREEWEHRKKV